MGDFYSLMISELCQGSWDLFLSRVTHKMEMNDKVSGFFDPHCKSVRPTKHRLVAPSSFMSTQGKGASGGNYMSRMTTLLEWRLLN